MRRRVAPVGRRALLVDCGDLAAALALASGLERAPLPGQVDVRVGACTVLVRCLDAAAATVLAAVLADRPAEPPVVAAAGRTVHLEVVYDGEDLAEVAELTGRSAHAVVAEHTGQTWTAAFGGFAPGFVYLSGDGPSVPRRASPRTRVPAGAVGLAGAFSAVYPRSSPGGWQLLGRTSAALWDVDREPPALVAPGDRVRFVAVREAVELRPRAGIGVGAVPVPGASGAGRLLVLAAGPLSLVEDLGRRGLEAVGVPGSGAADRGAATRANRLVGNPPGAALVETLGGLVLRAVAEQVLVVTGPPGRVAVDRGGLVVEQAVGAPFAVPDGAEVHVGTPTAGLRRYVAVRGGLAVRPVLGSSSADVLSGLGPPHLTPGAALDVAPPQGAAVVGLPEHPAPWPTGPLEVPVVLGPRADWFTAASIADLCAVTWRVTDRTDRVGVRLAGPRLERDVRAMAAGAELPSEPMVAGAIQVPPSGEPVVLLVDHPVTGGYPVVAVVVEPGLDLLAQARPGQEVVLRPVAGPVPGWGTAPGRA